MNIKINVIGGTLNDVEIQAYIQRAKEHNPYTQIETMNITVIDDNYVDIEYHFKSAPFQRIRRVTGYLSSTLDRFNNAKRAEVNDRVKHSIPTFDFADVYIT